LVGVFSNIGGDTCTRIGGNGGISSTVKEKKKSILKQRKGLTLISMRQGGFTPLIILGLDFVS
jgi:hypothetical protein